MLEAVEAEGASADAEGSGYAVVIFGFGEVVCAAFLAHFALW